ncbi:192fb509-4726-48d8-9c0b-14ab8190b5f9 [Thermothielavioides terrestris]|uniref:DNA polymerase n=1 Tax=Thermothielavioides terrestris TaxID=2587410 RepID=A0A3S4ASL0_9PEZI|nr:192fb509-4726-48d8-9c0b-14ab8190b5f9 [Thermothielavioides terrestris]
MTLSFPIIFLLSTNLGSEELQRLEEQIPTLTYDINEAEIVLGKVFRKERALFELRKHKLATEEVDPLERSAPASPSPKRAKLMTPAPASSDIDSDTASEGEIQRRLAGPPPAEPTVRVVKLAWFTDSVKAGVVLPTDDYLVYEGRKVPPTAPAKAPQPRPAEKAAEVMKRALADAGSSPRSPQPRPPHERRGETYASHPVRPLLRQTTSEHDIDTQLPPIPDYLHTPYSCQRPTPVHPPNEAFMAELDKIKTARTLTGDKIGVRAYSSAIATIAAYPYTIQTAQEVARLPGCGSKIARLFQEFKDTGQIREAREDETDPKLAVLKLFYGIWGVAETTARDFYNRGWRDLDDIVEYGWDSLTRVQQIGVKYYDEFQTKIPRAEVESIANIILEHANKIRQGFQMVIVGGYRRGKLESGDVDVVLSHPDEAATHNFVERIVVSLERNRYVTHTLSLSTANSERGQAPVSWKGDNRKAGTGFDTLDKALVVWQDPVWTTGEARNPNPHRRVDIIISPWKTAGCAVLGWTSGTTFQRDLRRYCKKELSLKFDSSGVRSRKDGSWVDLESGPDGKPAPDMLTAERRVFAGLGLQWRPPEERCTG